MHVLSQTWIALTLVAAIATLAVADEKTDKSAEHQLQLFARSFLPKYEPTIESNSLRSLVRLEPEMFTIRSGQVHIELRALRPIATHQQVEVIKSVESLLLDLLTKSRLQLSSLPDAPSAGELVRKCTITFGEPVRERRLQEATKAEVLETIHAAIEHLTETNAWKHRFIKLTELRLRGADAGPRMDQQQWLHEDRPQDLFDGKLRWVVTPRSVTTFHKFLPPLTQDVQREANLKRRRQRNNQFNGDYPNLTVFLEGAENASVKFIDNYSSSLNELVDFALFEFQRPPYGYPLLEPAARRFIKLDSETEFQVYFDKPGIFPSEAYRRFVQEGNRAQAVGPGGGPVNVIGPRRNAKVGEIREAYNPAAIAASDLTLLSNKREIITPASERQATSRQLTNEFHGFQGGSINALAISPDDHWLAAAGDAVRIWNLATGELEFVLRGEQHAAGGNGFTDVAFSPDGRFLAVVAADAARGLRIYDVANFTEYYAIQGGHAGNILKVAYSPDGSRIATYGNDQRVIVWDAYSSKALKAFAGFQNSAKDTFSLVDVVHLSLPSETDVLLANAQSQICRVRDPQTYTENPKPEEPILQSLQAANLGKQDQLYLHTLTSAPTHFVMGGVTTFKDNRSEYWCDSYHLDDDGMHFVLPDGKREGGTIPNRGRIQRFNGHRYKITACALNKNGTLCASADALGKIFVWDCQTANVLHAFSGAATQNYAVSFGDSVNTWQFGDDFYTGVDWQFNRSCPLHYQFDLPTRRFSSIPRRDAVPLTNGRLSFKHTAPDFGLAIVESNGSERKVPLPPNLPVTCSAWFPRADGKVSEFIVGQEDGSLTLFDSKTFVPKRHFLGHSDRVWSVATQVSSEGRPYLVSTGGDGVIRVWSLENLRPRYNIAVQTDSNDRITYVYPHMKDKALLRPGDRIVKINGKVPKDFVHTESHVQPKGPVRVDYERDGKIFPANITLQETGDTVKPLLNAFISKKTQDWILWTESGYYDCSPGAERFLGWHENFGPERASGFVSSSQIQGTFFRSDVIDRILADGSETAALENADRARDGVPRIADGVPPEAPGPGLAGPTPVALGVVRQLDRIPHVRFIKPHGKVEKVISDRYLVQVAVAIGEDQPDPELTFTVNGVRVRPENAESKDEATVVGVTGRRLILHRLIPLLPGTNEICAVASVGELHSYPQEAKVTITRVVEPDQEQKSRLIFLAIGAGKHTSFKPLQYAAADADAMTKAFKQITGPLEPVVLDPLLEEAATMGAILEKFEQITSMAKPGDTCVIHFSTHGFVAGEQYYLAPVSGDPKKPLSTCISWTRLMELSSQLQRHVRLVLFVDTCHSEGISESIMMPRSYSDSKKGIVFAACDRTLQAFEEGENWKHGVFTLALLEALENKPLIENAWKNQSRPDGNGDGRVSTAELHQFLYDRVRDLTGEAQSPVTTGQDSGTILFDVRKQGK